MSLKHRLVVVSIAVSCQLHVYSMDDGSLVREIGTRGNKKGQFDFVNGVLCTTPDGDSVLVVELYNDRVQEVRVVGEAEDTSRWIRFVGEYKLRFPTGVDCNEEVIVVSEGCHQISVFSWRTGNLLSQLGSKGVGPGQLWYPSCIRLLGNGSRLVVCDWLNRRLCVFKVSGEFVEALDFEANKGVSWASNILEMDGGFVVRTGHSCFTRLTSFREA